MKIKAYIIFFFAVLISEKSLSSQLTGEVNVLCIAQTGQIVFFLRKNEKSDSVININVSSVKYGKVWELQNPEQVGFDNWTIIKYSDWSIRANGQVIVNAKKLIPNEWYEVRYLGYGILGRNKFKYQRPSDRSCIIEAK